jgi:prolyl 4-hydroxylase
MNNSIVAVAIVLVLIVLVYEGTLKTRVSTHAPPEAPYTRPIVYQNVVSPLEAGYILTMSAKDFVESDTVGGRNIDIRKSQTAWIKKDDPVVSKIIQRVCDIIDYPIENAEDLQVVKYEPGGFYKDHHDSCCDDNDFCRTFSEKSGQRVLTMLIYLNDNFTGGSTTFKNLDLDVKPEKFGGVLFRPLEDGGGNRCHPLALHRGNPIESGVKYICNVWIREKAF